MTKLVRIAVELAAGALIAHLTVIIWIAALLHGGGRVLFDVNHYHEGWAEVGLFGGLALALGFLGMFDLGRWLREQRRR